jgi:hypothetical protein
LIKNIRLDKVLKPIIVKMIFHIHQFAFLNNRFRKRYRKIQIQTIDYYRWLFLADPQITKEDKDWLYPRMIQGIKKIANSIILVFSPTKLSELVNYG